MELNFDADSDSCLGDLVLFTCNLNVWTPQASFSRDFYKTYICTFVKLKMPSDRDFEH